MIPVARIIPARAGFTSAARRARRPPGDHPRTRGVYVSVSERLSVVVGSSPHARGLLMTTGFRGLPPGIIPARAGFTHPPQARDPSWRDHPRTRGVYNYTWGRPSDPQGSSPHARGLLISGIILNSGIRIIPARAGFTGRMTEKQLTGQDHPRTRGVYSEVRFRDVRGLGSSPHARGLLTERDVMSFHKGIIPARAGFTPPPRVFRRIRPGSSPHARGLLSQQHQQHTQ